MPRLLVLLFCFLRVLHADAQDNDSSIDEVKKQIATSDDEERVEHYKKITRLYLGSLPVRSDSAIRYARKAYAQAKKTQPEETTGHHCHDACECSFAEG